MPVGELCNRHQIVQSQYYKWRDALLQNGNKVFEVQSDKKTARLESKVKDLTNLVGALTIELKKSGASVLGIPQNLGVFTLQRRHCDRKKQNISPDDRPAIIGVTKHKTESKTIYHPAKTKG